MSGGNGKVDLSGLGGRGAKVPILNQKPPEAKYGFGVMLPDGRWFFKMKHDSFAYQLDQLIPEYEGLKDDNEDLCDQIEKLVAKIKGLERKLKKEAEDGNGKDGGAEAEQDNKGLGEAEAEMHRKEQVGEAQPDGQR